MIWSSAFRPCWLLRIYHVHCTWHCKLWRFNIHSAFHRSMYYVCCESKKLSQNYFCNNYAKCVAVWQFYSFVANLLLLLLCSGMTYWLAHWNIFCHTFTVLPSNLVTPNMLDIISNLRSFSTLLSTNADVHVWPLSPSLLTYHIFFHNADKNSQHKLKHSLI